jgi:hypothetical protein
VRDVNYVISKKIEPSPNDAFVLDALNSEKIKQYGE